MKQINAIAGLPRSGSTLLCNIFNQNTDIHATSTSCLPFFVKNVISGTEQLEFKNLLDKWPVKTENRLKESLRNFVWTWHSAHEKDYVFDKSRGWTDSSFIFRDLFPERKIIVCVRDLRDIFASIVKQDRKNGVLGGNKSIQDKYSEVFGPQGIIGFPLKAIYDIILTPRPNIIFLRYENFVANPKETMFDLYNMLGIPPFEHDFEKVENTSYDCDGFYLNKFPHKGSGIVKPTISKPEEYIPIGMIQEIMRVNEKYNRAFGYN